MILNTPFKFSKKTEKKFTLVLVAFLAVLVAFMRILDPLSYKTTSNGIVAFELAKDLLTTKTILNSWDVSMKISAGISLGLDFLFLLVYSLFIALLIHKLNEYLWKKSKFYKASVFLIYAVFFAAFCDVLENLALIQLLLENLNERWSAIAFYCASTKFIILALAVIYIFINVIILLAKAFQKK